MPKRYHNVFHFAPSKRHRVEAEFTGAEVTANGGIPLLAEANRRMGLTEAVAKAICDDRRRKSVVHSTLSMVRQRVYALLLGHEDLSDHDALRRGAPEGRIEGPNAASTAPPSFENVKGHDEPCRSL